MVVHEAALTALMGIEAVQGLLRGISSSIEWFTSGDRMVDGGAVHGMLEHRLVFALSPICKIPTMTLAGRITRPWHGIRRGIN